ncbi:hypothetical protein XELAEV_18022505mg [Xenopus laevis]|uniref:Transmembrane protein n=1 Tax=Xenopus laevis TaxID=8355 RepID=A0A974D4C4_XENLA|nr:hypothetical protein XELAEV_18022505mg [Xenopus laevis]
MDREYDVPCRYPQTPPTLCIVAGCGPFMFNFFPNFILLTHPCPAIPCIREATFMSLAATLVCCLFLRYYHIINVLTAV